MLFLGACDEAPATPTPIVEAPRVPAGVVEAPAAPADERPPPAAPVPSAAVDVLVMHAEHAPWEVPDGAPVALVHAPLGALDVEGGLHVVLFLHGYMGCVEVLARSGDVACTTETATHPGFAVVETHDAAGTATVLVVAQLAWMTRDGDPGGFREDGAASAFLDEVLVGAGIERPIATVTIAAHSAAFESSIAIVRQGGLGERLRNVVLLDALYSGGPAFLGWVRGGTGAAPRTLVSLYTGGTTLTRNRALARDAAALGDAASIEPEGGIATLADIVGDARVLVLDVPGAHGDVPRRHLADVLRALDLPRRAP